MYLQMFIQTLTFFKKFSHAYCTYVNLFICMHPSVFIHIVRFRKIFIAYQTNLRYFNCLSPMKDISKDIFGENLSFIIQKYEAFHLQVSGNTSLDDVYMKSFLAYITNMKHFTSMCKEMLIEVILFRKSFASCFTNIRLFSGMCQEMSIQATLYGKSFIAYFTNMWLFTRMCSEMLH